MTGESTSAQTSGVYNCVTSARATGNLLEVGGIRIDRLWTAIRELGKAGQATITIDMQDVTMADRLARMALRVLTTAD